MDRRRYWSRPASGRALINLLRNGKRAAPMLSLADRKTPAPHRDGIEGKIMRPSTSNNRRPRVLFVQATNPGAYPPLIHASMLMAEAGWEVTFLSAPIAGDTLALPSHQHVTLHAMGARPSHVMSKRDYAAYAAAAARLALRLRPDVVYASDPLGAGPGLLAARLAGARLVYHEHDSPQPGTLNPVVARLRWLRHERRN